MLQPEPLVYPGYISAPFVEKPVLRRLLETHQAFASSRLSHWVTGGCSARVRAEARVKYTGS